MTNAEQQVPLLLEINHPATFTASQIVRHTKLSFSAVRSALNKAREQGYVDRELDIGLGGHTIYQWYYKGGSVS
jgi:DNA-binding IclR family transcriptional regulator